MLHGLDAPSRKLYLRRKLNRYHQTGHIPPTTTYRYSQSDLLTDEQHSTSLYCLAAKATVFESQKVRITRKVRRPERVMHPAQNSEPLTIERYTNSRFTRAHYLLLKPTGVVLCLYMCRTPPCWLIAEFSKLPENFHNTLLPWNSVLVTPCISEDLLFSWLHIQPVVCTSTCKFAVL